MDKIQGLQQITNTGNSRVQFGNQYTAKNNTYNFGTGNRNGKLTLQISPSRFLPEIQRMIQNGPPIVAERHMRLDKAKLLTLDVGSTCDGNVHWMVPRTINSLFTGRSDLLLRIQNAIRCNKTSSPSKQKRFVITGLAGQGKSEICLQVASQIQNEYV
jgi:hypothetical protein